MLARGRVSDTAGGCGWTSLREGLRPLRERSGSELSSKIDPGDWQKADSRLHTEAETLTTVQTSVSHVADFYASVGVRAFALKRSIIEMCWPWYSSLPSH